MSPPANLADAIANRGIEEIVHFTSNNGLVGALELGALVSRRVLPEEKHLAYVAAPTAAARAEASAYFDKGRDWLDYINLSVSELNSSYFRFASKWHVNSDRWWALLSFSPEILLHDSVVFTTTNNVYEHVRRASGLAGFEAMFMEPIRRKGPTWAAVRRGRGQQLPTCEQAEVLYPTRLSLDFLRAIYVRTEDQHDLVSGWISLYRRNGVNVVISAEKFLGAQN